MQHSTPLPTMITSPHPAAPSAPSADATLHLPPAQHAAACCHQQRPHMPLATQLPCQPSLCWSAAAALFPPRNQCLLSRPSVLQLLLLLLLLAFQHPPAAGHLPQQQCWTPLPPMPQRCLPSEPRHPLLPYVFLPAEARPPPHCLLIIAPSRQARCIRCQPCPPRRPPPAGPEHGHSLPAGLHRCSLPPCQQAVALSVLKPRAHATCVAGTASFLLEAGACCRHGTGGALLALPMPCSWPACIVRQDIDEGCAIHQPSRVGLAALAQHLTQSPDQPMHTERRDLLIPAHQLSTCLLLSNDVLLGTTADSGPPRLYLSANCGWRR
jgi:hypothetical protein